MDRRTALAKATITTTSAAAGILDPTQARAFVRTIKEKTTFGQAIRQEVRTASAGEIDKLATGSRIIRAATEDADDGYRAGATFATVPYQTVKVRLPWEVTEDVFHENIEGDQLEADLTDEMTTQFGLDLDDVDINGDTAAGAGPDQAFLQINDGILKQIVAAAVAGRNINGSTINAGVIAKEHFFAALKAMPNKYRQAGNLQWLVSPNRALSWWEALTARAGAQGDALLGSRSAEASKGPLGLPFLEVSALPDSVILLANPRNFVRVVSWQVRKRRVTGETDATLAAKDKRFYVFFLKEDIIIEETDAVVRVHTLTAP